MKKNGFSLIEVMIGVAILAGMSLVVSATLNRALTSKVKVERKDEILHSARLSLEKMTDDLTQAFLSGSAFKGKEKLYETGMKGGENQIIFSTLSHFHYVQDAKDTDQILVSYFLSPDTDRNYQLMRSQTNHLQEKLEDLKEQYVLIEHVKEFGLEYYDSGKEEWVKEWDTASVSNKNRLPQAVRINLLVVELSEEDPNKVVKEYPFSTTVAVDLYKNEINF